VSEQDNTSDDIILGVSYSNLEKNSAKIKMLENEILNMFFKIDRLERELTEANEENEKLKADLKVAVEALKEIVQVDLVTHNGHPDYHDWVWTEYAETAQEALKKIEGE